MNDAVDARVVLIIDDDPMMRMLATEALEPEGFRVVEAINGLEGIDAFQGQRPDVILLDVSMPGIDGFECCRRIRALPGGEHVPIVVLTGNDDDESISNALRAGATDFISKPMQWPLLGHRIRYLLHASDAFAQLARSEAQLASANAELIEMNSKLALAHVQLAQSEKLASIGQLAAGVAHEINNPIGYIFSNFGALENYLDKLFCMLSVYEAAEEVIASLEAASALREAKREVELEFLREDIPALMQESKEGLVRVRDIVQGLKDFSRVDQSQQWQRANIHHGLDSTLKVLHGEIKLKANVVREYGELPDIDCVLSQLNQVFMNLVLNAVHAMDGKLGTITIRTSATNTDVHAEFSDNGTGIAPENIARLFEPFFTTKPVGKGTGLGLSISYGIIQNHHGEIRVESQLGLGTTFHIRLPIVQPEQIEASGV